jgi:hypothetical protein
MTGSAETVHRASAWVRRFIPLIKAGGLVLGRLPEPAYLGGSPSPGVMCPYVERRRKVVWLDEFLAWEYDQPERYEYVGGVVTIITAGSAAHVTIAINLAFALLQPLRGASCRPFNNDMRMIANDTIRYPSIVVEVNLDTIYEDTELDAIRPREGERQAPVG